MSMIRNAAKQVQILQALRKVLGGSRVSFRCGLKTVVWLSSAQTHLSGTQWEGAGRLRETGPVRSVSPRFCELATFSELVGFGALPGQWLAQPGRQS